jgi:hypothetical protein
MHPHRQIATVPKNEFSPDSKGKKVPDHLTQFATIESGTYFVLSTGPL